MLHFVEKNIRVLQYTGKPIRVIFCCILLENNTATYYHFTYIANCIMLNVCICQYKCISISTQSIVDRRIIDDSELDDDVDLHGKHEAQSATDSMLCDDMQTSTRFCGIGIIFHILIFCNVNPYTLISSPTPPSYHFLFNTLSISIPNGVVYFNKMSLLWIINVRNIKIHDVVLV